MAGRLNHNKVNGQKKDDTNKLMIFMTVIAGMIVFSLILWSLLRQSDLPGRHSNAFRVGKRTYSVSEINYYYYSTYYALLESMNGYENLFGLDVNQDLSEQECPLAEEKMSWKEYILQQAEELLAEISVKYQDAVRNGYSADSVIQSNVENAMEYQKMMAADGQYPDLQAYLQAVYKDLDEDTLRELLAQEFIAQTYEQDWQNALVFSDEELSSYYESHLFEFSTYSYLYSYVGKDETPISELKEAESEQEFRELTKTLTGLDCYELMDVSGSELGDNTTEDLKWISDVSRKKGDTYIGQSGNDHYVLYYLGSSLQDNIGDRQWKVKVSAELKKERLIEWNDSLLEKYGSKELFGIRFVAE